MLYLSGCTGLSDLAPLTGLASLRMLYLGGCTGLTDLAPLANLVNLRELGLNRCSGLSDEAVTRLQKLLPNVGIAR
jgi:hypothetical protein